MSAIFYKRVLNTMSCLKENYFKIVLGVLFTSFLLLLYLSIFTNQSNAQYDPCSEYGIFAYEEFGYCKCMSGYVFGKDFLGNDQCVSADQICKDKYGYNSKYSSLNSACECSYGYVFGKDSIGRTQCVSPDSICEDRLGFNSKYNSLSDTCECSYGYVISGGQCVYGNSHCRAEHGLYSSYDNLTNSCECDSEYTFDDDYQCVKKQNNVYFTLKELDTDKKQAIIRSDYDYSYYLINYGSGCYASSFKRYVMGQIVVNLGTDHSLDIWDKIVLQDDNEVCDITRAQRADSSTTIYEEEIDYGGGYYTLPSDSPIQPKITPAVPKPSEPTSVVETVIIKEESEPQDKTATNFEIINSSIQETKKESWFKRFWKLIFKN